MPATHMDMLEETVTEDYATTALLRENRVRTARRRIAEGRYDSEECLDAVVETILNGLVL